MPTERESLVTYRYQAEQPLDMDKDSYLFQRHDPHQFADTGHISVTEPQQWEQGVRLWSEKATCLIKQK